MQQPRASACSRTRVCIWLRAPTCGRTSPQDSRRIIARERAYGCMRGSVCVKWANLYLSDIEYSYRAAHSLPIRVAYTVRCVLTRYQPVIADIRNTDNGSLYASGSPDRKPRGPCDRRGATAGGGGGERASRQASWYRGSVSERARAGQGAAMAAGVGKSPEHRKSDLEPPPPPHPHPSPPTPQPPKPPIVRSGSGSGAGERGGRKIGGASTGEHAAMISISSRITAIEEVPV